MRFGYVGGRKPGEKRQTEMRKLSPRELTVTIQKKRSEE
jgi:hypothetical protein